MFLATTRRRHQGALRPETEEDDPSSPKTPTAAATPRSDFTRRAFSVVIHPGETLHPLDLRIAHCCEKSSDVLASPSIAIFCAMATTTTVAAPAANSNTGPSVEASTFLFLETCGAAVQATSSRRSALSERIENCLRHNFAATDSLPLSHVDACHSHRWAIACFPPPAGCCFSSNGAVAAGPQRLGLEGMRFACDASTSLSVEGARSVLVVGELYGMLRCADHRHSPDAEKKNGKLDGSTQASSKRDRDDNARGGGPEECPASRRGRVFDREMLQASAGWQQPIRDTFGGGGF